jgi:hypothetical protein
MWALLAFVWEAIRVLHASLGFVRGAFGLAVCVLLFRFYEQGRAYLELQGLRGLPEVPAVWIALSFAGLFLIWHLLRYAILLRRDARPVLSLKILDPSERYETYVALGNRLLRLYHVELENASASRPANNATVSLECYQQAGDKRQVDIRSKLKVANSDADEVDLKPRGRVVFELCGVEAIGSDASARAEARDNQTFSIVPPGSGTIRVLAEALNAPAKEEHYTLYVDRTGTLTIKPQAGSLGASD